MHLSFQVENSVFPDYDEATCKSKDRKNSDLPSCALLDTWRIILRTLTPKIYREAHLVVLVSNGLEKS